MNRVRVAWKERRFGTDGVEALVALGYVRGLSEGMATVPGCTSCLY